MNLGIRIYRMALILASAVFGAMLGAITIPGDPLVETLGAIGGAFVMFEMLPKHKDT